MRDQIPDATVESDFILQYVVAGTGLKIHRLQAPAGSVSAAGCRPDGASGAEPCGNTELEFKA